MWIHFGRVLIIAADAVGPPTGMAGARPEGRGSKAIGELRSDSLSLSLSDSLSRAQTLSLSDSLSLRGSDSLPLSLSQNVRARVCLCLCDSVLLLCEGTAFYVGALSTSGMWFSHPFS